MNNLTLGYAIKYICEQTGKTEDEVMEMPLQDIMLKIMANQIGGENDE
ncbi:hypothetical protein [Salicibibacter kimchii]|nr:hypothetical protein [Salicibibacter kimchii]